jgi:hypothetical protein
MFEMAIHAAHHVVGWDEVCGISLLAKTTVLDAGFEDKVRSKALGIAEYRF